jgi:hypothetical protein
MKRRKDMREKFILNGGLNNIIKILLSNTEEMQVLAITMQIFSIYHHAFILSTTKQSKLVEVNRLISLKETLKDLFNSLEDRSDNFFLDGVT